jgi:signal transduction histidine kinase
VLNELVTNALKHGRPSLVRVEIRDGAGKLELDVADNGCGMPPDAAGGSGLMIVRAVVRNELAGVLSFIPEEHGTRVRITLPRPEGEGGERDQPPPAGDRASATGD